MRKILFRGKREDNSKWIFGSLVPKETNSYADGFLIIDGAINYDELDNYQPLFSAYSVIPETVGQYTGLDDKNGTKIFEGDIVKFGISQRIMYVHWNEETLTWELTDIGISVYEANHLLNTVDLAEIQVESAYGEVFSEVIGNMHDNLELLS